MNRSEWNRVEEVFDRVADLAPGEQRDALERECGGDADLLRQVSELLEYDRPTESRIAAVIEGLARIPPPPAAEVASFEGRVMGPYRILREIGRGGMGMVFEAIRDDGQFEKRVALKIAAQAVYSPEFLTRFRNERQILAQLEHPHIARLLDGGATAEQIPFFAMEYVDGEPIDRYAETRRLGVSEVIELFLQVCEAVEYAHQHLVIHRDLKPGNILVADGFARLLDFGIAKITGGTDGTLTRHGGAPLTPDYCSPEQLRGGEVTARTDVYSLGLILYRLLTGDRGQVADVTSPLALDRSVCEMTPPAPSVRAMEKGDKALARKLRGDIDTIVLTAIEKDPARRYSSAHALRDDLRRYLDGQPIQARPHSAVYRAVRFARRHWVGLSAVAGVIAALTVGLVSTAYQAQRAERRFQQVRKIAKSLMDDVEESIRDLPGSIKAREIVVRTAVDYLDALLKEAGGDAALQSEVADGYVKIAGIAYAVARPSLGRPDDARLYFEKSKRIMDSLYRSYPADAHVGSSTVGVYSKLGLFLLDTGHRADALMHLDRAVSLGESSLAVNPNDKDLHYVMVDALTQRVARFYMTHDSAKQVALLLALTERLVKLTGDAPNALSHFGLAHSQAGKVKALDGDDSGAIAHFRRNVEVQTKLVGLLPNSSNTKRNLSIAWVNIGDAAMGPVGPNSYTGAAGPQLPLDPKRRTEAFEAYSKALELARTRLQSDSKSDQVRMDLAIVLGRTSTAFPVADPRAFAILEESLDILGKLPGTLDAYAMPFAMVYQAALAERHRQAGQKALADAAWRATEAIYHRRLKVAKRSTLAHSAMLPIYMNWAIERARRKDRTGALELARKGEQLAVDLSKLKEEDWDVEGWPPRVKQWTAQVYDLLGEHAAAQAQRAAGAEMWRVLLTHEGLPRKLVVEAKAAVAQQ